MATISEGTRVAFADANGEAKVGTVIEYTGANDGTGSWEYRVECGRSIYGVSEDDIEMLDDDVFAEQV